MVEKLYGKQDGYTEPYKPSTLKVHGKDRHPAHKELWCKNCSFKCMATGCECLCHQKEH